MGVIDGLLRIREQRPHLFLRFYIILAALVTHAVLIRHLFSSLDTQKNIVCCRILCQDIVDIVGCHQVHGKFAAHAHKPLVYGLLRGDPVVLQLQKEISFSENFLIMSCRTAGLLILDLARQTGA